MLQNKLQNVWVQQFRAHQQQRAAATPTAVARYSNVCPGPHPFRCPTPARPGLSQLYIKKGTLISCALPNGRGVDVVGFGNLCVDAVLPMEQLPPADVEVKRQLLETLTKAPPDRSSWEVGGNCNFMVAAARLGLQVTSVGHIGTDVYGEFMDEVLQNEHIQGTIRIAPAHGESGSFANPVLDSTLICFVLVDPASRHAFCSRYDFGPWPLLAGIRTLPGEATSVLRAAHAVFTNGFIFDELPLEAVKAACTDAIQHGAAIFFDPGPRCQTMLEGPRRAALDLLLDLSAVVLMTEEEARVVTGLDDPEAAAQWVLARSGCRAQWVVVKLGSKGALLCTRKGAKSSSRSGSNSSMANGNRNGSSSGTGGCGCTGASGMTELGTTTRLGAVKVEVVDTVGCGDSFAAAIVKGFISGWTADVTLALANAVGGATATGRGAGRNVARIEKVLALLEEGAVSGAPEQRSAFARARELLIQSLASRRQAGDGQLQQQQQLSAAA